MAIPEWDPETGLPLDDDGLEPDARDYAGTTNGAAADEDFGDGPGLTADTVEVLDGLRPELGTRLSAALEALADAEDALYEGSEEEDYEEDYEEEEAESEELEVGEAEVDEDSDDDDDDEGWDF